MSGEKNNADNPGVIAPPPLIYACALAAGLLANRRYHMHFLPRRAARTLGWPPVGSQWVSSELARCVGPRPT